MNGVSTKKTTPQQTMEQIHLVIFRLAKQAFALPIEMVYQIIEMVSIRPVPKINPIVEGVISVHGRVVPVIDLHRLLYNSSTPRGLHTPIILTHIKNQMTGLIVDEVLNVSSVFQNEVAKPSDFLPMDVESIPIIRGLTNVSQETIILLELNYLFEFGQSQALSQVSETLNEFRQMPVIHLPDFNSEEEAIPEIPAYSESTWEKSDLPEPPSAPEVSAESATGTAPDHSAEASDSAQGFGRVAKALEEMHRDASPEPSETVYPDEPRSTEQPDPIELPVPPEAPAEIQTAKPKKAAGTHTRKSKRAPGE
jgi:purine-binding chemotaxis protein CheW